MVKIGFVVLHYNVSDETKSTVDSILKNVNNSHVVIVDNCSPNDSYSILINYYKDNKNVTIVKNTSNAGYASGINFGYNYLIENYYFDFIVAMNNDMELTKENFTEKVYEIYERTNFDILGPDIYSTSAKKHQNPENNPMRNLDAVEAEILKIKHLKEKQNNLRLKSFIKSFSILERIYYVLKSIVKPTKKINEELVNPMLHGSFYVFSQNFISKRSYALYPKTNFYCEAQILDYEAERDGLIRIYSPEIQILHHEDVATNSISGSHAEKMNKKYNLLLQSLTIFRELILEDLSK
ncbi:glycosyltransferase family 2 protein [Streptococcus suis]|nr:glycosyltransferase family 2 protein [Streptococcus suis]